MASIDAKRLTSAHLEPEPPECDLQAINNYGKSYKLEIVWPNVFIFFSLYLSGLYGFYLAITSAKFMTTLFALLLNTFAIIGVTAGAHRLWSHHSYKANLPLRIILMLLNTSAFMTSIWNWCREHRLHHKYTDTDADPHNASRGFFFSHVGWLLVRKHPAVKEMGKKTDLRDIESDPVVMFQKKYYLVMMHYLCFIIPSIIPIVFWGETPLNSIFVAALFRVTLTQNFVFLINSAAHLYGTHPYDRNIYAAENPLVSVTALGEGWHNYHHTFPWDYKAAELGNYSLNLSTAFIDFFAMIGWAYDLKTAPPEIVKRRMERTGDKSMQQYHK